MIFTWKPLSFGHKFTDVSEAHETDGLSTHIRCGRTAGEFFLPSPRDDGMMRTGDITGFRQHHTDGKIRHGISVAADSIDDSDASFEWQHQYQYFPYRRE